MVTTSSNHSREKNKLFNGETPEKIYISKGETEMENNVSTNNEVMSTKSNKGLMIGLGSSCRWRIHTQES